MLTGEIKTGDAQAVEAMVRQNLPFLAELELNSNGGNVDEAIQIGRIARRYYLVTEVPESLPNGKARFLTHPGVVFTGASCASACFFAWLGGVNRFGEILEIHRPFPPATYMQKLSPDVADQLYRKVSAEITDYLFEIGAAPHWLTDMMKISSNDLFSSPITKLRTS